jgi:hypothetical protein
MIFGLPIGPFKLRWLIELGALLTLSLSAASSIRSRAAEVRDEKP